MTETKWVWLDDDKRQKLIEEISGLASELMKSSECGKLTKLLYGIGSMVFKAARPIDGWGSREIVFFWGEDDMKMLEETCKLGEKEVEKRLRELANKLSEPAPTPLNPFALLENLFPEHYSHLNSEISGAELELLNDYDDQDIRDTLARILMQSDIVPSEQKAKLRELSHRPHTGYEIADFELLVEFEGDTFRIDFVIKSGAELSRNINEADVWYQIDRPFEHGSDLVVFLSYADLTIPLKNKIRSHGNEIIYIINKELALLFKNYEELT